MTTEEVDDPVIHFIRHVELGYFVKQGGMSDSVKRLAEIQRYNDNIWIVYKHYE